MKGRLGGIFSKQNIRGSVEEKGERNMGVGQACALIPPPGFFCLDFGYFDFLRLDFPITLDFSMAELEIEVAESSLEMYRDSEGYKVDHLSQDQMEGPVYIFNCLNLY